MKLIAALVLGLAVGGTAALPQGPTTRSKDVLAGLPDGGYMIGFEDDGTPYIAASYQPQDLGDHNLTLPAPAPHGPESGPASLGQKSPATSDAWGCVETEFVDPNTWMRSAKHLGDWCDAGNIVHSKKIMTWLTGDSEAYICNWAGDQGCSSKEYNDYMAWPIDYFCSRFHSGWFLQGSGNKGYGRGVHGQRGESKQICFNP